MASEGLYLSNPNKRKNLLTEKGMNRAHSTSVPYFTSADLSKGSEYKSTVDVKYCQCTVGTLIFFANTTHPGLAYILGILGRQLHDLCERHFDATKPILRYLSSRKMMDLHTIRRIH